MPGDEPGMADVIPEHWQSRINSRSRPEHCLRRPCV